MEPLTLDPYEQQLLAVFNRYDYDNLGSLDENGLLELCHTLQLQEQGTELIGNLLNEPKKSRVKFIEFKDALLTLLGNMQKKHNKEENKDNNETKGSPDREVSPKYIYGSKKYGRRSRPKSDLNPEQNDPNYLNVNPENPVQRSNSEVCNSKKRRTNFKLKRCTSLPSKDNYNYFNSNNNKEEEDNEFICTEEMLRKAWKNLGVGEDGHLNRDELILVCDAIGLHNLAGGVLRQLSDTDYDRKISFRELLDALKRDETWSDILLDSSTTDNTIKHDQIASFPDSQTFQYISLGPEGNGTIGTETVIDMWESVGITAPKELLHELGFDSRQIKMAELASVLDSSLKSINEASATGNGANPHICLLQASLSLYQSEIRCLKGILEQLNAEKDKLKLDITEANNRATLLAQEVDDNHLKMQENTLNQVRSLEQRHSEILKNLSRQFAEEKEELSQVNTRLEKKIANLEGETSRLKNDILTAKSYLSTVENENGQLTCKIAELNQSKQVLEGRLVVLEGECRKYSELEHEQIRPLLEKLNRLEVENGRLRDRGDEMGAEIETLNGEISALRGRGGVVGNDASMEDDDDEEEVDVSGVFGKGGCVAAKRRNEGSPSKDACRFENDLGLHSPRLGKIRKLPKSDEDLPNSGESGFSTEVECSDNSLCRASPTPLDREVKRLQAKIVFLEQILQANDIVIPSDEDLETVWKDVEDVRELKNRVRRLENVINAIKRQLKSSDEDAESMIEKLSEMIVQDDRLLLNGKAFDETSVDVATSTDDAQLEKLQKQNGELTEKCAELENCIELLRNEYEKCEDYWASKLDEERQIFEQEQSQSNEKFAELFGKMREYEEQFASQVKNQQEDEVDSLSLRLQPIIETYSLEKQFTDLEEEYDDFRNETETLIERKDLEIEELKEKLTELATRRLNVEDRGVQVDELNEYALIAGKMAQLTAHVVECTSFSNWTTTSDSCRSSSNVDEATASSTAAAAPCRPKRTKKQQQQRGAVGRGDGGRGDFEGGDGGDLEVLVRELNGRRLHLEQRCRHLQAALKEQRFQAERTLQHCWQSQQNEKAELQCVIKISQEKLEQYMHAFKEMSNKLARTDMLVKDLYVENSYLIANVQRLEQQRNIFAQCNTNNSL